MNADVSVNPQQRPQLYQDRSEVFTENYAEAADGRTRPSSPGVSAESSSKSVPRAGSPRVAATSGGSIFLHSPLASSRPDISSGWRYSLNDDSENSPLSSPLYSARSAPSSTGDIDPSEQLGVVGGEAYSGGQSADTERIADDMGSVAVQFEGLRPSSSHAFEDGHGLLPDHLIIRAPSPVSESSPTLVMMDIDPLEEPSEGGLVHSAPPELSPEAHFGTMPGSAEPDTDLYISNNMHLDNDGGSMTSLASSFDGNSIPAARLDWSPAPLAPSVALEELGGPLPAENEGGGDEAPVMDTLLSALPVSLPALEPIYPTMTVPPVVAPALPAPDFTHISNPTLIIESLLLENPLLDSAPETVPLQSTTNDVVFNHDSPFQDFEKYNFDFAGFFGNLWNHQVFMRGSLGGRSLPRVSPEAKRIQEWALTRPREITREDEQRIGDMQGIEWGKLEITHSEARRIRKRSYLNYRNVKQFEKEDLPPIKPNKEFFRFRSLNTAHICRLMHFQLRNILCVVSRNDIFYSIGGCVIGHHPVTSSTRILMDLRESESLSNQIRVSTLGAYRGRDALLIAGGFRGNYALQMLNSDSPIHYGNITDHTNGITNHIQIISHRTSGHPTAVFSSNDAFIRIMDCGVPSRPFLAAHPFDWAVNCSATSPDSRLRVVVGDSKDVLIVDADRGSTEFVLNGHQDFGFAAAWSDDGYTIATGNQDQTVRIFDARNLSRAVKVLPTVLAGCRTLRFSPIGSGGKRVLAMAEPADYLHIVDAVNWEDTQTIQFWGEIGGLEFSPQGEEIVVANCDRSVGGIMTFERCKGGNWFPATGCPQQALGRGWRRKAAEIHELFM